MSNQITIDELKRRFPGASESTLRRNLVGGMGESHSSFLRTPRQPVLAAKESGPRTAPASMEERLNKTEQRFLTKLRLNKWDRIGIQNITIRLAHDLRYTPDLTAWGNGRFWLFEVKGAFIWDRALHKPKMAAAMFPEWNFVIVQWKDGQWKETMIPA